MLFFPYRVDADLYQLPLITILICITCIVIYARQASNEQQFVSYTEDYCASVDLTRMQKMVLHNIDDAPLERLCEELMFELQLSQSPQQVIDELADVPKLYSGLSDTENRRLHVDKLSELYRGYAIDAPRYLTQQLWYEPDSWNPLSMITAAFAHGSWPHLIGNLFFFFAFAATLEAILGSLWFMLLVLGLAIGTHVGYSLSLLATDLKPPTVGLSGVVMGMVALFSYLLPRMRIRCFAWIIVFFKTFALPAWLLAAWYVGWDIYSLFNEAESEVNFVAHVAGAMIGVLVGVIFLRGRRQELKKYQYG